MSRQGKPKYIELSSQLRRKLEVGALRICKNCLYIWTYEEAPSCWICGAKFLENKIALDMPFMRRVGARLAKNLGKPLEISWGLYDWGLTEDYIKGIKSYNPELFEV